MCDVTKLVNTFHWFCSACTFLSLILYGCCAVIRTERLFLLTRIVF